MDAYHDANVSNHSNYDTTPFQQSSNFTMEESDRLNSEIFHNLPQLLYPPIPPSAINFLITTLNEISSNGPSYDNSLFLCICQLFVSFIDFTSSEIQIHSQNGKIRSNSIKAGLKRLWNIDVDSERLSKKGNHRTDSDLTYSQASPKIPGLTCTPQLHKSGSSTNSLSKLTENILSMQQLANESTNNAKLASTCQYSQYKSPQSIADMFELGELQKQMLLHCEEDLIQETELDHQYESNVENEQSIYQNEFTFIEDEVLDYQQHNDFIDAQGQSDNNQEQNDIFDFEQLENHSELGSQDIYSANYFDTSKEYPDYWPEESNTPIEIENSSFGFQDLNVNFDQELDHIQIDPQFHTNESPSDPHSIMEEFDIPDDFSDSQKNYT